MLAENWRVNEASHWLCYSGNRLDRVAPKRADSSWIEQQINRDDARFIVFVSGSVVLTQNAGAPCPLLSAELADKLPVRREDAVFLGVDHEDGDTPYFAQWFTLKADDLSEAISEFGPFTCAGLRAMALTKSYSANTYGMLAQAAALSRWHSTHPKCSICGADTEVDEGGYRRKCPSCEALHFPRTDPAVIMLISYGDECLLGRPYHLAENMYSTLAGFVEPGETMEDAVRREVFEEAGVEVGEVSYVGSQPWPFPSNIMLGFRGVARSKTLNIDYQEMQDCQWFTKEETAKMLGGIAESGLFCPPDISISHYLIRSFVNEG
ncbi:NAD(+) diphosphatase [Rhodobacteraceae bacterium RKSG542]|uniref:NAD(+) diphosphatase n=1 Tax=Pseudovibrio flavus TaxID=2529854 RepID=UPI0012BB93E8|nr:NAD(+) diphosphatase [Pseudovibrio flavus]MTI17849.1 NAD(+) diphosphatase [Pseudovibrio flavus]